MKKFFSVKTLTLSAAVAALYVVFTLLSNLLGLALGVFEFRLSEGLCILPVFTPMAIPGLVIGCVLANLLSGSIVLDVIFGSLATLLGAVLTRLLRKKPILALLPPILANTAVVPPLLYWAYGFQDTALPLLFLSIFLGEALSAGVLGFFLYKALWPLRDKIQ